MNKCQEAPIILIVDDRPNNLQLLFEYLKDAGYKILIAENGQKAIETAEVYNLDLILLDIMMSGIDGFATCNYLKKQANTKDTPIIFMTALSETQHKVIGFEVGAVDYITKPINREELLARIKSHLSLQRLHQSLAKETQKQKLLLEISSRIRECLELKSLLETANQEIHDFLGCDRTSIVHLDNSKNISLAATSSSTKVKFETTLSWDYLCINQEELLDRQEKIKFVDPIDGHEKNWDSIELDRPIRIIAPILIHSKQAVSTQTKNYILWGWLIIEYDEASQWRTEEIKLLEILTTQLAIGIKQALLFEQLSLHVSIDPLTQVYNRRHFHQQLSLEWRRLKRASSPLSLIICDVDHFKLYNDTYGHQQGDKCLWQLAQAMSSVLKRPGDILVRYGGEEFIVMLPQTLQSGAIQVAENIRQTIKDLKIPHPNSSVDSVVTLSLGVATAIPSSANRPQSIIEEADLALYQAKERGRDCVVAYSKSISRSQERRESQVYWVKRLRNAIDNNLFSLYAQSITPLNRKDSRKCFEILLRLTDREDREILPGAFMNIAERNFLMIDIDTWVVNNLFDTLQKCYCHNWENFRFSINLSGSSLNNESFLQFLKRRLTESSLPPELFCFEITESVAVDDINRVNTFIHSLKKIGCSFALDDFGKGVSSLHYLQNLPVDYLKIDGSFIKI